MSLKGALLGYGYISSQGHAPAYLGRKDVEITAVADVCDGRRAIARQQFPKAHIYSDPYALLKSEAANLDFVDIATPPQAHAPLAEAALKVGLHVLCEKPLTTDVYSAEKLLLTAKAAQRVLFPCHNYKHAPVVKAVREILDSGRLGQVRSVTLNTFRTTHARGVSEWRPHWRRDPETAGGGIATDHGIHSLYLIFEWMRAYPTSIAAKMTTLDPGPDRFTTEDNVQCLLSFPTGLAQMNLSWTAGVRQVVYLIQCEKGALNIEDDHVKINQMISAPPQPFAWQQTEYTIASDWMDASHQNWFNSLFDQFYRAIENREIVNSSLSDAIACVRTISCAYQSARQDCREIKIT